MPIQDGWPAFMRVLSKSGFSGPARRVRRRRVGLRLVARCPRA